MTATYDFEEFTVDPSSFELRRNGDVVPTEPLVMDLILHLVRNPGRLLTRDELVEAVWNGRFVSESTISTAIKTARKVLDDDGVSQRLIRTVRGRGVQFNAHVLSKPPADKEATSVTTQITLMPALCLRVAGYGGAENASKARLFEMRMRTVLSRIPMLRIAAHAPDPADLADPRSLRSKLGLTLLAEIDLHEMGGELRSEARLVDTNSGLQVWAHSFRIPTSPTDLDEMLSQILSQMEPAITRAMIFQLEGQDDRRDPHADIVRAMGLLAVRGWNRKTFLQVAHMLEEALQKDDAIAFGHAYLALVRAVGHRVGILTEDSDNLEKAIRSAERALELENGDSVVLSTVGCAFCDAGQLDRGLPILDRSIELNPENGHALTAKGAAMMMRRDFDVAERLLREGMSVSPSDSRLSVWGAVLALAEIMNGAPERALVTAREAAVKDDTNHLPRLAEAAALAALGDTEGLHQSVGQVLRIRSDIRLMEVRNFVGERLSKSVWTEIERQRPI